MGGDSSLRLFSFSLLTLLPTLSFPLPLALNPIDTFHFLLSPTFLRFPLNPFISCDFPIFLRVLRVALSVSAAPRIVVVYFPFTMRDLARFQICRSLRKCCVLNYSNCTAYFTEFHLITQSLDKFRLSPYLSRFALFLLATL